MKAKHTSYQDTCALADGVCNFFRVRVKTRLEFSEYVVDLSPTLGGSANSQCWEVSKQSKRGMKLGQEAFIGLWWSWHSQ